MSDNTTMPPSDLKADTASIGTEPSFMDEGGLLWRSMQAHYAATVRFFAKRELASIQQKLETLNNTVTPPLTFTFDKAQGQSVNQLAKRNQDDLKKALNKRVATINDMIATSEDLALRFTTDAFNATKALIASSPLSDDDLKKALEEKLGQPLDVIIQDYQNGIMEKPASDSPRPVYADVGFGFGIAIENILRPSSATTTITPAPAPAPTPSEPETDELSPMEQLVEKTIKTILQTPPERLSAMRDYVTSEFGIIMGDDNQTYDPKYNRFNAVSGEMTALFKALENEALLSKEMGIRDTLDKNELAARPYASLIAQVQLSYLQFLMLADQRDTMPAVLHSISQARLDPDTTGIRLFDIAKTMMDANLSGMQTDGLPPIDRTEAFMHPDDADYLFMMTSQRQRDEWQSTLVKNIFTAFGQGGLNLNDGVRYDKRGKPIMMDGSPRGYFNGEKSVMFDILLSEARSETQDLPDAEETAQAMARIQLAQIRDRMDKEKITPEALLTALENKLRSGSSTPMITLALTLKPKPVPATPHLTVRLERTKTARKDMATQNGERRGILSTFPNMPAVPPIQHRTHKDSPTMRTPKLKAPVIDTRLSPVEQATERLIATLSRLYDDSARAQPVEVLVSSMRAMYSEEKIMAWAGPKNTLKNTPYLTPQALDALFRDTGSHLTPFIGHDVNGVSQSTLMMTWARLAIQNAIPLQSSQFYDDRMTQLMSLENTAQKEVLDQAAKAPEHYYLMDYCTSHNHDDLSGHFQHSDIKKTHKTRHARLSDLMMLGHKDAFAKASSQSIPNPTGTRASAVLGLNRRRPN